MWVLICTVIPRDLSAVVGVPKAIETDGQVITITPLSLG